MSNNKNKKKLCILIDMGVYNKVFDFAENNQLLNRRLVPGAIVEMGLNLFFKELQQRPLADIASEYLTTGKPGDIEK